MAKVPEIGTIDDGYKFKGGDPASPNSWEQVQAQPVPSADGGFSPLAALQGAGQALTFGHLPLLQAAAQKVTTPVFNVLTGSDVETLPYRDARQEAISGIQQAKEQSPLSFLAGNIAGIAPQIALPQTALGAGLRGVGALGRLGASALSGATAGALQRPEEGEGIQALERIAQAKRGAIWGGAFQTGGEALGRVGAALKKAVPKLAFRAAGAFKADAKRALLLDRPGELGKRMDEVGNALIKEKLIQAGDKIDDIANRIGERRSQIGQDIGSIYDTAAEKLADPNFIKGLGKQAQAKLQQSDLNPFKLRTEFLSDISKDITGKAGAKQALNEASNLMDEFVEQIQGKANVSGLQRYKESLDDLINYDTPKHLQKVNFKLREFLKDKIQNRLSVLDDVAGEKQLGNLIEKNKLYNILSDAYRIAKGKTAADASNALLDLRSTILGAGLGAGIAGAPDVLGGTASGDVERIGRGLKSAAIGAGVGAGARRYGMPLLLRGAQTGGLLESARQLPIATGIAAGLLQR